MSRGLHHLLRAVVTGRGQPVRSAAGAHARPRPRRALRMTIMASAGCAALALAGCAHGLEDVYSTDLWVEPGKFDFYKCPDLAKQSLAASAHEKELVSLMERANQSAAGPVVNVMVYDADLKQTRAQLALLQRTAHEKGCDNLVPDPKGGRAR